MNLERFGISALPLCVLIVTRGLSSKSAVGSTLLGRLDPLLEDGDERKTSRAAQSRKARPDNDEHCRPGRHTGDDIETLCDPRLLGLTT